jgi:hypothetical protein
MQMNKKFTERKHLRVSYPGGSVDVVADVKRLRPAMGFAAPRFRAMVIAMTNLDELSGKPTMPERGLSLYEGEKLLGDEGSWRQSSQVTPLTAPFRGYVELKFENT